MIASSQKPAIIMALAEKSPRKQVDNLHKMVILHVDNDKRHRHRQQVTLMNSYSISTCFFGSCSPEEMFEKIAHAGFKSVELASENHLDEFLQRPGDVRRRLENNGLRARSIHSPRASWNIGATDQALRHQAIHAGIASFAPAAEVGAEIIVCHCNASDCLITDENYNASKVHSVESLATLAEEARKAGVKLAVENLPNYGRRRPSSNVAELLEMIQSLPDNVGICIDTGHANLNRISPAQEIREAAGKLMTVHIHDNDGQGEDQHLMPHAGTTNWQEFVEAMNEMAFAGPRTFEVTPEDAEIDDALKRLCEIRSAWNGLG